MQHYDVVICGAGLSGRILAYYLVKYGNISSLLLIDSREQTNEALISYWGEPHDEFDHLVIDSYAKIETISRRGNIHAHRLQSYRYKYFYKSTLFEYIDSIIFPACELLIDTVTNIQRLPTGAIVTTKHDSIHAKKVYSSIPASVPSFHNTQYFTGIELETDNAIKTPLFMDFSVYNANNDLGFGYALPLTKTTMFVHLVHYSRLPTEEECREYAKKLLPEHASFTVTRHEQGATPLYIAPLQSTNSSIVYIGKRGGYVNPATGFGFTAFCEHAKSIVGLPSKRVQGQFLPFYALSIAAVQYAPRVAQKMFEKTIGYSNFDTVLDFIGGQGGIKECVKIALHVVAGK